MEKIDRLLDEVMGKDLELQTMPGLVEEVTKLRSKFAKFPVSVAEDELNVGIMSGLQKENSIVKEAVADLSAAVEKSRYPWVEAEKNVLREMKLRLIILRESFCW